MFAYDHIGGSNVHIGKMYCVGKQMYNKRDASGVKFHSILKKWGDSIFGVVCTTQTTSILTQLSKILTMSRVLLK